MRRPRRDRDQFERYKVRFQNRNKNLLTKRMLNFRGQIFVVVSIK